MKFRELRIFLTENTKIDLVTEDWKQDGSPRELLPKPVSKDNDALQEFDGYFVTKIKPLDYGYVKVYLDQDGFRKLIIRRNDAGKWEGVDPVTGKVFTQEEMDKAKQKK